MQQLFAEASAMARTVKRARGALVEAVRAALDGDRGIALRAAHTQVFECLDPEGTRLTTLAERAGMSHQAMGEMVDDLVRQGLLERVPDPADGRARLIRPTTRGRAELARAAAHLDQLRRRWEHELEGITVTDVLAALDTLIRICEEQTSPAATSAGRPPRPGAQVREGSATRPAPRSQTTDDRYPQ